MSILSIFLPRPRRSSAHTASARLRSVIGVPADHNRCVAKSYKTSETHDECQSATALDKKLQSEGHRNAPPPAQVTTTVGTSIPPRNCPVCGSVDVSMPIALNCADGAVTTKPIYVCSSGHISW